MGRIRSWVAAATLAAVAGPAARATPPDPTAREWNQVGGNAAHSRALDVEPLRSAPVVAWRRTAGPNSNVVWEGGFLYFVDGGLRAVRMEDGKDACPPCTLLPKSGRPELCVCGGWVIAWTPEEISGTPHLATGFGLGWRRKNDLSGPPLVAKGRLYGSDGEDLVVLRPESGSAKPLAREFRSRGRLAWDGSRILGGSNADLGAGVGRVFLFWSPMLEAASSRAKTPLCERAEGPHTAFAAGEAGLRVDVRISGEESLVLDCGSGFLAKSDDPEVNERRCVVSSAWPQRGSFTYITLEPVSAAPGLVGYDLRGNLACQRSYEPLTRILVEKAKLPQGAVPGPASAARDVLYMGNWAWDLSTSRALWTVPVEGRVAAVLPAGDRRVLLVAEKAGGEVEFLLLAEAAGAGGTSAAAIPAGGGPPPPARPPSGPPDPGPDGLVLRDGTVRKGRVAELPGRLFSLEPPEGPAETLPAGRVALAVSGGRPIHRGGDLGIYLGWRAALLPGVHDALDDCFRRWSSIRLVDRCREILAEGSSRWELPRARREALEATLRTLEARRSTDVLLANLRAQEKGIRQAARKPFFEAASWCLERGHRAAAAALLDDAALLDPDGHDFEAAAKACLPPEFPFGDAPRPGALWRAWARALLPSDASFAGPEDPGAARLRAPWDRAVVLLTDHVRLATLCRDPAVVGPCLRNGEWTVRVLEDLVGPANVLPPRKGDARLDVRLHATRKEYLEERLPSGGHAMPWSAGFFVAAEGVSRFFVPEEKEADALGRGLFQVLAHELTHHFLELRWKGASRGDASHPGQPGFWCVEGIARFVEDQVVDMALRGPRLDDRTVRSVDACAQASAEGWLFRPSVLLQLSQAEFAGLPPEPVHPVQLRNTLAFHGLSPLALFYEQAGTTVFFLLNERGPAGREAFFRFLTDYYRGGVTDPVWKTLGFAGAKEFDAEFLAFLAKVR